MNQQVQFGWSLLKTLDVILLSFSFLSFPISRPIALSAIALFFLKKILSFSAINRHNLITAIALYTSVVLLAFNFYQSGGFEVFTHHHLYPVTPHDYLVVLVTFLAIQLNPLTVGQLQKVLAVFSLTPLIVFLTHWQNFSFTVRTDMGFENPNLLGLYLAIAIPVLVIHLLQNRSHFPKYFRLSLRLIELTTLLIAFLMLLASGSKSSLLVTLFHLGLILFYLLRPKLNLPLKPKPIVFFSLICLVILMTSYFLSSQSLTVLERFFSIWDESSQLRVQIYACFFNLALEKFWFGWFPENTAQLCENQLGWLSGEVNHAHNFILQLFVDYGIIAVLIILSSLIILLLLPMYRYLKASATHDENINYLFSGLFLSNLAIVLVSLLQSAFYHDPFFPLWFGLFLGSQNALLLDHQIKLQ